MTINQTNMNFHSPVIDVSATSKNLKSLREGRGITVSEIQNMFGMENPQSIYNWENPERKTLPCIDNLVLLAEIYKVTLDELIVIKEYDSAEFTIKEPRPAYGISDKSIDFIHKNASESVRSALVKYFGFSF